ncbi:MAG TPA: AMP-binding protein [Blastocatellia bacterium]|nr:AMP-binding protein [Blastocatellia bacterium]
MAIKSDLSIWEAESFGVELLNSSIGDTLDQRAAETPDKEALVYNYPEIGLELRMNYAQYQQESNRLARALIGLGVNKGDHIAVWAPNYPEWVFLSMALAKIGAVLVTVNTAYRASELEYVLRQGRIRMLFTAGEHRGNSYINTIYDLVPELAEVGEPMRSRVRSGKLPCLERVISIRHSESSGIIQYDQLLEGAERITDDVLARRQASVGPGDVIQMQYTSGTTGFPKGVMLTHANFMNQAHVCCSRSNLTPDERLVTAMPFFHVAGSIGGIVFSLYLGCTLIPLISFDAPKLLELFAIEKATMSFNVPTMLIAMLGHPRFQAGEFELSSLRNMITGATPVPVVLMEQVRTIGAECSIVYGMTELSGAVTQSMAHDTFETKSTTVGLPLPHMDLKIVNPASGDLAEIGQSGELLARGPLVMKGYYDMPEKTAEVLDSEGWLHSGDLATMDAHGYVNIVGRVKDMIIRGGENIYPAEIEEFLMRHPSIVEAQVVGVPDAFMGEEVAALVRLKAGAEPDEDELRAYCRAGISRHKVPKYIRFVNSYPLTSSGKVKKFELKQQLSKELNLT